MYHYYQFYKPAGCVTALRDETEPTIMEYLTGLDMSVLRPIGRLDRDTEGLLILTDDGKYNQRMTHPDAGIEKEYFFWAIGSFTEEKKKALLQGTDIAQKSGKGTENGKGPVMAKPAKIDLLEVSELGKITDMIVGKRREHILKNRSDTAVFSGIMTVTEGQKHEVRRLLKSIGCYCIYLKRIRMGEIRLDPSLKKGEVRAFMPEDIPQQ